jgi:hypothetical protein
MADAVVHDGAPAPSSPPNPDRPSSAGSAGQLAAVEPAPAQPPVLSDEMKARLDKVIYSDVSFLLELLEVSLTRASIYRSVFQPS